MKKILFLLIISFFTISSNGQKLVGSLFLGGSNYYDLNTGVEAGIVLDRLTILATGQINYSEGITLGFKSYLSAWLVYRKEVFVAPVVGAIQMPYYDEEKKYQQFIPVFGVRYQVYGGFGEIITNLGYIGVGVGYMFGNRKE